MKMRQNIIENSENTNQNSMKSIETMNSHKRKVMISQEIYQPKILKIFSIKENM